MRCGLGYSSTISLLNKKSNIFIRKILTFFSFYDVYITYDYLNNDYKHYLRFNTPV